MSPDRELPFADRVDAGRRLAERLRYLRGQDVVVVGLPRGGVPVAREVARALGVPLDVIVVRKLGVPSQPELAMGALGEGGVRVINPEIVRLAGVTPEQVAAVDEREHLELDRRAHRFREGRRRVALAGRTVVIVDDGIATGSTARAACEVARAQGATRIVLATPVAPPEWTERLAGAADEFVCVATPTPFRAIGQFYVDFDQTTDAEVIDCLRPPLDVGPGVEAASVPGFDAEVAVHLGDIVADGRLTVPTGPSGVVVFAHGSGSSRHSPRNVFVASVLHRAGLATLLFDLLSATEERYRANVFDVELLGHRLVDAVRWVRGRSEVAELPVGCFGASTGAAAALWAAAEPGLGIGAVVSRGGRPDLTGPRLEAVRAPTLLIVGGRDEVVLDLNRDAQRRLSCENDLAVVSGATHLFEEPGTLMLAAGLASTWFVDHLAPVAR